MAEVKVWVSFWTIAWDVQPLPGCQLLPSNLHFHADSNLSFPTVGGRFINWRVDSYPSIFRESWCTCLNHFPIFHVTILNKLEPLIILDKTYVEIIPNLKKIPTKTPWKIPTPKNSTCPIRPQLEVLSWKPLPEPYYCRTASGDLSEADFLHRFSRGVFPAPCEKVVFLFFWKDRKNWRKHGKDVKRSSLYEMKF